MDDCRWIDAYLEGTMDHHQVTDFASHLADCADCQREIEIAGALDTKLQDAWSLVRAPERLQQTVSSQVASAARHSPKTAGLSVRWMAVAAAVGVVAAWLVPEFILHSPWVGPSWKPSQSPELVAETERPAPQVTFRSPPGSRTILVEQARSSPNFTIVKTYSAVQPQLLNQPEIERSDENPN